MSPEMFSQLPEDHPDFLFTDLISQTSDSPIFGGMIDSFYDIQIQCSSFRQRFVYQHIRLGLPRKFVKDLPRVIIPISDLIVVCANCTIAYSGL